LAALLDLVAESLARNWISEHEFEHFRRVASCSTFMLTPPIRLRHSAEVENREQALAVIFAWVVQGLVRDWLTVETFRELAVLCERA
jgi:hypothetical protein